ncbi:MAG: hypothetical protein COB83_06445 [Gammaproteobacteria bacterium]|nr:MAG: hypothetical protein COB83_06445 [Gammaproteobacteria bacterium]
MVHLNNYAVEPFFQVHKVDQSGAYGVNIGVGDNFFNQQEFNWAASYSRIEDVNVTWAGQDINFSLDTIDLTLSYRYYPKSYNTFIKSLIFEFQAGVGIAITENKFVFRPNLDTDDVYFSEQGDVNVVLAFLVHKKISKQLSMQIGIKSYPDYSDFGDISSVFLGFSYQFGKQVGY